MLGHIRLLLFFGAVAIGLAARQKVRPAEPFPSVHDGESPATTALALGGGAVVLSAGVIADAEGFKPAPVVPLASEPPARLVVDSPLPEQLSRGYVVVRYRAENLRIMPVYGPAAQGILPRIGHLHITVDDLPWHWLDASGEPLSINGLPPGPHKILVELEDPAHKLIDSKTVSFEIPQRQGPPK